jgi:broad specificity phosphatase PhoE
MVLARSGLKDSSFPRKRESSGLGRNDTGSPLSRGRRSWLRAALLVLCAFVGTNAVVVAATDQLGARPLLAALKAGGLVLYFRHASTDFGQNDDQMTGYEDCAKQRNLTDAGRAEARAIGAAIKRLGVPVGSVLASPFCRTMETAQLIFDRAVATPAARGGPASVPAERYAGLRRLLASAPPSGTNTAIVSHGNPFRALTGEQYLAEGEAAVIQPLGNDQFRILARIPKDGWDALAAP